MNLQTFKAPTMAEALTQVKSAMGSDAIILHTRTFATRAWLGLRRREMVEITAGKGINIGRRRRPVEPERNADPRPESRLGATYTRGGLSTALSLSGANAAKARGSVAAIAPVRSSPAVSLPSNPVENGRQLLETPGATNAAMLNLAQEMSSLKEMVSGLVNSTRQQQSPQVPKDLFDYYMTLIQNQVTDELATEVVRTIHKQVRPEHFTQQPYMRERIADLLDKIIPTAGPIARTKALGPHVVALIGPTGVGKTTTLAKLAANLKIHQRHRVGLITLDTYRIAAVDQLKRYADIIGSPLRVVGSADELREARRSMSDCDFILIDTAGRSPNDILKLNELKGLIDVAEPDEVHLVLSTTVSQSSVELAVARFGEVRVDKIIFTKIDEAAHVGIVLNVVRKVNKGLSYITTGQNVPDDIEVGRGKRLAQLILSNNV
jgi:flagellar biosynthesis protein FlhF